MYAGGLNLLGLPVWSCFKGIPTHLSHFLRCGDGSVVSFFLSVQFFSPILLSKGGAGHRPRYGIATLQYRCVGGRLEAQLAISLSEYRKWMYSLATPRTSEMSDLQSADLQRWMSKLYISLASIRSSHLDENPSIMDHVRGDPCLKP